MIIGNCSATCAAIYPFCIAQDATFYQAIFYTDPDTDEPLDITGYTGLMQIRSSATATEAIETFTTSNGKIVINGPEGLITLLLSPEDTADLPAPFSGVYDLFITSTGGTTLKILSGTVNISKAVSYE